MSGSEKPLEDVKPAEEEDHFEDAAPGEEVSLRQRYASLGGADGESSEIQLGTPTGPAASASSTEGASPPQATPMDFTQALLALTTNLSAFIATVNIRLDQLEAQARFAPAPAPPAVPVAPVAPAAAAPQVEPSVSHFKQTVYNYNLRKFGGKETYGDITQWVHTALQLVPPMCTKGEDGEPERISMVLKALEGQPRAVAENVFSKAARDQVQVTWKMLLEELLLTYGDPDAERSARRELNDLRQKSNEDVISYLTRFDALALRISDLTDKDAVSRIEAGLREPHKSMVNKVYLQQKVSQPDFEFTPESLRTMLKRSNKLEPTASGMGLNAVSTEQRGSGAGPSGQQQRGPYHGRHRLSDAEHQRCLRERKCFKCKHDWSPGHQCEDKEPSPNEGGVQSPTQ